MTIGHKSNLQFMSITHSYNSIKQSSLQDSFIKPVTWPNSPYNDNTSF